MSTATRWFSIESNSSALPALLCVEWKRRFGAFLLKEVGEKKSQKDWGARREKLRARLSAMTAEQRIALLPSALWNNVGSGLHTAQQLGIGSEEGLERYQTLTQASIAADRVLQEKQRLAWDPDDVDAQAEKEKARIAYLAAFDAANKEERRLGKAALARAAAALAEAPRSEWHEKLRLLARPGNLGWEAWLLRTLMHDLDPETAPAPEVSRLTLSVKVVYPSHQMPGAQEHDGVRGLAMRLLTSFDDRGPLAKAFAAVEKEDLWLRLPFIFEAQLVDRKPKSGTIHVLATRELVEDYREGLSADSMAW
jgi:hypothetical protein